MCTIQLALPIHLQMVSRLKSLKFGKYFMIGMNHGRKIFYARTIPFPVKDSIINPSNGDTQYEYILGTTVTLDTIFPNLGANDKYGYNTIPTTDYYFNPVIDATERGNHTFTPGVISSVHWAYDRIFACKIIATTGDTLIISNDKHFLGERDKHCSLRGNSW